MAVWEEIRHQVAIVGTVTGSGDGNPLGRVRVSIVDGPPDYLAWIGVKESLAGEAWPTLSKRPDRVWTTIDGHFHFMDLPDGDYTLSAGFSGAGTRYGTVQRTVTVTRTPGGDMTLAQGDLVLPASMIRGTVTRQGMGTAVVMAEVRVQGSGEYAHTDEHGAYRLWGIEASATRPRILTVSARGYQDQTVTVLVAGPGDTVVNDLTLSPL